MIFNLYCKIEHNFRAPGRVNLDHYENVWELEAINKTEAIKKWYQLSKDEQELKDPEVGDLVAEEDGSTFILTPQGLWSTVEVVNR